MAFECRNTGSSPAHVPVLAEASVELLACSHGKVVVDGTIGSGGHAELILAGIGRTGHLIGIDWDQKAIELARERLGSRPNLILVRENFRNLAGILQRMGLTEIDALLLDLGLSSFQIEEERRGFSFQVEGPLDMRMDRRLPTTAADIVNTCSEKEIADILKRFGQEPNAREVARAVIRKRSTKPIRTTTELAGIIRGCVPQRPRRAKIDPATKTFQALRIKVNSELENLRKVLDDGISLLSAKGRICVISFHSLEDRIVKQTFVRAARGCICPPELPQCACGKKPTLRILTPRPVRPSGEEIAANPRSRSAKLRAAEKIPVGATH
ncbi:MAG: 16S rRNA (cytosine(1402)-N(4))-methyltransferase RsmH [Candidatus Hydrogenedentota bacterium]|nr:MAG: 16S rRNA (cytosine(1402)-N(4))-methyltransferase RsmH [Candidatus Hydrogenedentota bacterium]